MLLACPIASVSLSLLSSPLCGPGGGSGARLVRGLDYGACGVITVCKSNSAYARLARQLCERGVVEMRLLSASENNNCVCLNLSAACSFVYFSVFWFGVQN